MINRWLAAVASTCDYVDTDRLVAEFLAEQPDRLWSLTDVLVELQHQRDLEELRDAVDGLISESLLADVVGVVCDDPHHDDDIPGSGCTDPLCGDALFRVDLISRFK
ncbi:hypothetical protein [[Mycobacterium] nativiensis]|uniref:Uncharacterized protein n=1 Tax=[Mycobacterium] nativiensis TaxID=2855503 RepID=A0ABU5XTM8_9MYCO|nr:hypothetical protein [Mycolicibacter sp. MYC340]MEB3031092.1 hypothetical protein [Mycolicibacter sp. MYC340]